ncbi:NAD(P)H-hydrate dehydratase [Natronomonas sp.]|uniref:NAD(P)H-hydrate dehydratase n=1 Tax=Natronomonas sp. TaxID=2184060 RepID=UPI002618812E|nr:NAD(P)H-hydrate dehydratase [Natronomonas sp.]
MISSDEMAVVDANAAALGVPRKQLMESSGSAVARAVRRLAEPGGSVALVCGRGNNGGDAFVAARFLPSHDVTVRLLGRPAAISTAIARENFDALEATDATVRTVRDSTAFDLGTPDVVVDAMLGTGATGALREPEASAAAAINDAEATVVSVDVPSGVDADTGDTEGVAVEADHVVTFHDGKPGLSAVDAEVTVAEIGIPAAAERTVERGDLLRLSRVPGAHKGDFGRVLVVGGGPYAGAPALAAQASLRAGADLSSVVAPVSVAGEIQGYSENLIVTPLEGERLGPDHVPEVLSRAERADCVVVGPGLGDASETRAAVRSFLGEFDGTAVVDADALGAVPETETDATLICTPHAGELAAMGCAIDDASERAARIESFAADLGATLLVTGAEDVVSDGERTRYNRSGNAGMTVGGTGDVLAGVTGAMACVLEAHPAASLGAYATGRAGDLAAATNGDGLTATDLLGTVPSALWPEGR